MCSQQVCVKRLDVRVRDLVLQTTQTHTPLQRNTRQQHVTGHAEVGEVTHTCRVQCIVPTLLHRN